MSATGRIPLSELCRQDRGSVRPGELNHLRYLGMESIESGTGQLAHGDLTKTPKAPEANAFRFTPAHVLYGKLRPYLNKVFAPDFEGKCSTELVPLLPCERLDRRYLAYFLRSPGTVAAISQKVAGARMPRADMSFVMSLSIPLPALETQRRIVALLSHAENIVRMRREAEKRAKEIIPALFLEMFGNLRMNSNGGDAAGPREHGEGRREANPVVRLGDVAEVVSGVAKGRKLVGKVTREVPYLRVANVQAGGLDLAEMKYIPATADEIAELAVRSGDVLLTEGGDFDKVGRGALLEANIGECIHQNHVFRVRTHAARVVPEYFAAYLQTSAARQYFLKAAKKTSNLASINMTQLRNLPLPLPRLETQQDFQERFRACRALEKQQSDATGIADVSFQSLLAGVFSEQQTT